MPQSGNVRYLVVPVIVFRKHTGKLEFVVLTGEVSNFLSLRASAHTGVAIPRIDAPLLVEEFRETVQKEQTV